MSFIIQETELHFSTWCLLELRRYATVALDTWEQKHKVSAQCFSESDEASAYIKTALVRIHNDLILAMNQQKVSALILLDLSAAFDTINHNILIHRLSSTFGISGAALSLFSHLIFLTVLNLFQ